MEHGHHAVDGEVYEVLADDVVVKNLVRLGLVADGDGVDQAHPVDPRLSLQPRLVGGLDQHRPVDPQRTARQALDIELQLASAWVFPAECPAQVFGEAVIYGEGVVAHAVERLCGDSHLWILPTPVEELVRYLVEELGTD